jgi:hypothetical protein
MPTPVNSFLAIVSHGEIHIDYLRDGSFGGIPFVVTICRAGSAFGRKPLLVLDLAEFAATSPANGSPQADHPTTADARIICGMSVRWHGFGSTSGESAILANRFTSATEWSATTSNSSQSGSRRNRSTERCSVCASQGTHAAAGTPPREERVADSS